MIELTQLDLQILDFIHKNEPASLDAISAKFFNISNIQYRLHMLCEPEREANSQFRLPIPNTSYLIEGYKTTDDNNRNVKCYSKSIYTLTDLGKKALQDYQVYNKERIKELWLKNAWIPIVVTIATNLILSGIKQLWPLIQQLVSTLL